jgi:tetratricopeptide (TPR) repeat protein
MAVRVSLWDVLERRDRLAELSILAVGGRVFSALLLIPYFAWGIYTLRLRFRYYEDIPPAIEAVSLLGVAVFYAVEIHLLRVYLGPLRVYFIFAVLGLMVSGAALYGPMIVSLLSQLLVDVIVPGERSKTREPRYEPAEALEREQDYEGALREYMVMARIFPQEATVHVRIAECYMQLARPAEAVQWFERALKHMDSPESSLEVTNRLCEIYHRQLGRPQEGGRLLEAYLLKYPDAEYAGSVRARLAALDAGGQAPVREGSEQGKNAFGICQNAPE